MSESDVTLVFDKENPSVLGVDDSLCIQCGECVRTCRDVATVARMYEINKTKKPICIGCGQCILNCPVNAITEKFDYEIVKKLLKDQDKVVVFSIAPAVRVALSEEFGLNPGENVAGKIVTALKRMGSKYVFDITFGADLTVMEEAMELVNRLSTKEHLPMFTSCCPSWVKYAEIFYPEMLDNLSTCKSPIGMQGTTIKEYFTKIKNIDKTKLVHVVVAPCTAKKEEILRNVDSNGVKGTDYILTTRELATLIKDNNIDFNSLSDTDFDSPLGLGSGAGLIFGSTGGVCEATLRCVYRLLTNENLEKEKLDFTKVRGMDGIKEATLDINGKVLKVAVANGMANAKIIIDKIKNGKCDYSFVEVMSCPGGCIGGGGQPKSNEDINTVRVKRSQGLYLDDSKNTRRVCYQNKDIIKVYQDFYVKPGSHIAHEMLHTKFHDQSDILKG